MYSPADSTTRILLRRGVRCLSLAFEGTTRLQDPDPGALHDPCLCGHLRDGEPLGGIDAEQAGDEVPGFGGDGPPPLVGRERELALEDLLEKLVHLRTGNGGSSARTLGSVGEGKGACLNVESAYEGRGRQSGDGAGRGHALACR